MIISKVIFTRNYQSLARINSYLIKRFCENKQQIQKLNKDQQQQSGYSQSNISDDDLVIRGLIKDPNILRRHKYTLGFFGIGSLFYFFISAPIGFICYFGAAINILRVENTFLRLKSIYHDVWGQSDDVRIQNLNTLLIKHLIESPLLKGLIRKETLCLASTEIIRRSHSERHKLISSLHLDSYKSVQKNYKYKSDLLDVSLGTYGRIHADCVYNHDSDYYYRYVTVKLMKPQEKIIKILDNENTIDITPS